MNQRFDNEVSNADLDARHSWRASLRGALKRVHKIAGSNFGQPKAGPSCCAASGEPQGRGEQFCSWQNCPEELLKLAG